MFDDLVNKNMPPIRGSNCSVPLSQVKVLSNDVCKHLQYIYVELQDKNTKINCYVFTEFKSKRTEEFFKTRAPT